MDTSVAHAAIVRHDSKVFDSYQTNQLMSKTGKYDPKPRVVDRMMLKKTRPVPPVTQQSCYGTSAISKSLSGRDRMLTTLLFLCFLASYSMLARYTTANWPLTGDEPHYLAIAKSIVVDHDLDMANNPTDCVNDSHARLVLGRWRPAHMVGLPMLLAVPYGLFGRVGATHTLALISALTVALTYLLARRLSLPMLSSLLAAILLGSLPPFSIYSTMIYPEVPGAFLVVLSLVALYSPRERTAAYLLIGLVACALPWLVVRFAPLSVALAGIAVYRIYIGRRRRRDVLAVGLPCAVSAVVYVLLNQYIYGSWSPLAVYGPQQSGVGTSVLSKWVAGLSGWLFDQRVGLFAIAPFYLIGLAGLIQVTRRRLVPVNPLWICLGTGVFSGIVLPGFWVQWSPPTRYLVAFLPLLAIGVGLVAGHCRSKTVLSFLVASAVLSAIFGALVYAQPWLAYNRPFSYSQFYDALPASAGFRPAALVPLMNSSKMFKDTRPSSQASGNLTPSGTVYMPGVEPAMVTGGEVTFDDNAWYDSTTRLGAQDMGLQGYWIAPTYLAANPGEYRFIVRIRATDPSSAVSTHTDSVTLAVYSENPPAAGEAIASESVPLGSLGSSYTNLTLIFTNDVSRPLFFTIEYSGSSEILIDHVVVRHAVPAKQGWLLLWCWVAVAVCLSLLAIRGMPLSDTHSDVRRVYPFAVMLVGVVAIPLLIVVTGALQSWGPLRHHEAETMRRQVGTVRLDWEASNWLAVMSSEPGFMAYGPYVCTEPGHYEADFRVKSDGSVSNAALAAVAEVTAGGGTNVLASVPIVASELDSGYRHVSMSFTLDTMAALEVRLSTTGIVPVWLDRISITRNIDSAIVGNNVQR